jgi:hypothetical protein
MNEGWSSFTLPVQVVSWRSCNNDCLFIHIFIPEKRRGTTNVSETKKKKKSPASREERRAMFDTAQVNNIMSAFNI